MPAVLSKLLRNRQPPHPFYLARILHQPTEIAYLIRDFIQPWSRITTIEVQSTMQLWLSLYDKWIWACNREAARKRARLWHEIHMQKFWAAINKATTEEERIYTCMRFTYC